MTFILLFVQVFAMEAKHAAGHASNAEFDALWANVPPVCVDDYQAFRATVAVDKLGTGLGYRATLHGHGGAAAMGYGDTDEEARAHLAEVVEFNLTHNGRAIA